MRAGEKVDFVKSDSCFTADDGSQPADGDACAADYAVFANALNATGRPMVHSVKGPCGRNPAKPCSPPDAGAIANLRRAAGDAKDNWSSMVRILSEAQLVVNVSRPGFFADLDILEIGNGGLTAVEERAVFTMWSILKSPLLLGNNLNNMTAETRRTVGNKRLIAINQDPTGIAATFRGTAAGRCF